MREVKVNILPAKIIEFKVGTYVDGAGAGEGEGEGVEEVKMEGDEVKVKVEKEEKDKTEEDIMKEYGLEDYDEEEEGGEANLLGLGDLTSFADPKVSLKA